jgi:MFS family permease
MIQFSEPVEAAMLISIYGLFNAVSQPFFAALSDRMNRRKLFIQIGLVVMGLSTLGFIPAGRFSDLLVLRAVQGIGVALTIPTSVALLTIGTDRMHRGGAMGVYTTARMSGFALGPLIGGWAYDRLGSHLTFYIAAGFIGLAIVLVQALVKDAAGEKKAVPFTCINRKFIEPGILGAGLATFMMAGAFSMMTPLEQEFNSRLHETALEFGIAFSALIVSRVVLQIPMGKLSDRFGRKPFIITGMIVMAVSTALLGVAETTHQLIWYRVLQGIGAAGIVAPALALAGDLAKAGEEGRKLSIPTMGFGCGIAVGPLIAGILAKSDFELPFLCAGAMIMLGAWVLFRCLPETVALEPFGGSSVHGNNR